MTTVLYTANYGNYDLLQALPDGLEGVCWTDDPDMRAKGWEMRCVPLPELPPIMAAKRFKLMPHAVLPDADRTVWVDAAFKVKTADFVEEALSFAQPSGLGVFVHDMFSGIEEERQASRQMRKYDGYDLEGQCAAYRVEGLDANWGLWFFGVLARVRSAFLDSIFDAWWHECCRWGPQDQLSGTAVFHRYNFRPSEFPYQMPGPWLERNQHVSALPGVMSYQADGLVAAAKVCNAPPNTAVLVALRYIAAATGVEGERLGEYVMGLRPVLDILRRGASADAIVSVFRQC